MSEAALRYEDFDAPSDSDVQPAFADNVIRIDFGGPKKPAREIEPYPVDHLISGLVTIEMVEDTRQNFLDGANPLSPQEQHLLASHEDAAWWSGDDDY